MPLAGLDAVSFAYGLNHYEVDEPYRRLLRVFAGEEWDYRGLGGLAGGELYEAAYRIDRLSQPVLLTWGATGRRADVAWLDPLERSLLERLAVEYGVNAHPFQGRPWHHHYTAIYLVGDPGVSCILTITIQTAYALYKYAEGEARGWYRRLAGLEEPPWWGATWFTEAQGGSDLGANETRAEPGPGGRYRLTGYKYFASGAGIADVALVTARLPGAPRGAKGLSLFAVPRLDSGGRLNYRVTRLKWKSGTVAVPTGEVELRGSEAILLGDPRLGIYYTLEDLMVSRLSNSIGALGIARKAYLEAYGFASARRAFGRRVREHPLALRDLLEAEAEIEAALALTLYAITLFNKAWRDTPPYTSGYHHARLATHIAKNITAETAARVTQAAMELWGGPGFLHEYPVERWHREALITPIWEGTSNIQALDMLEAMARKQAHKPLMDDLERLASEAQYHRLAEAALAKAREALELASDASRAEFNAKHILRLLGHSTAVLLLLHAARGTGDTAFELAAEVHYANRLAGGLAEPPDPREAMELASLRGRLEEVDWDRRLHEAAPGW